jgi:hypothetical protein
MWKEIATHIRNVTIEVFEITKRNKCELKNTIYGGMIIYKRLTMRKKKCYKCLQE